MSIIFWRLGLQNVHFLTIICQTVQINNEIPQTEYHLLWLNHPLLFLRGYEAIINILLQKYCKGKVISTIHKGPVWVIVSGWGAVLGTSFICACWCLVCEGVDVFVGFLAEFICMNMLHWSWNKHTGLLKIYFTWAFGDFLVNNFSFLIALFLGFYFW